MINWRMRRQLVVLLILALPVVMAGFWAFSKFIPVTSCIDNKQNQGEVETDCGGPCGPCELKHPKALSLYWARVVAVRPGAYDVVAEIENTNEVLSSAYVEYEFVLLDGIGPIAVRRGNTFLYAQERLHVVESNIETTREPNRVEFKIVKTEWQYRNEPKPNLVVERRNYMVEEEAGVKRGVIEAVIANRAPLFFKEVEVRAVLLDKNENLLGANKIVVESMPSGSRQDVRFIWPQEIKGNIAFIIVEPRANIFSQ